jgi:hypothetical protein
MMATTTTTRKLAKKRNAIPPTPQPDWRSPHEPLPEDAITPPEATRSLYDQALAVAGLNPAPEVLAAIIIAQAADRLCKAMVEAAAVGRYRGA